MKECSPPPTEDVEWIVQHLAFSELTLSMVIVDRGPYVARTAWLAHQQVKGAPAFGSCRVVRVTKEEQKNGA
jgi:hypothetical protein